MRRIIAFLIDDIILGIVMAAVLLLFTFSSDTAMPGGMDLAFRVVCMILWLGYFVVADYYFHGITLGKKLLGMRMVWGENDGPVKISTAVVHTLLKCLLAAFWFIGLIVYLVSGRRMPYDRKLGISYASRGETEEKTPVWKTAACIVGGLTVFLAVVYAVAFLMLYRISSKEYYTVDTEMIPSVSMVLGRQRLISCLTSSNRVSTQKEYLYKVQDKADELAGNYAEYLVQNEEFE